MHEKFFDLDCTAGGKKNFESLCLFTESDIIFSQKDTRARSKCMLVRQSIFHAWDVVMNLVAMRFVTVFCLVFFLTKCKK